MKLKVYLNNEDGTFKRLDDDNITVDAYNRPYKGEIVDDGLLTMIYVIYDIEIKGDDIIAYVCKPGSKLHEGIMEVVVEVLDHSTLKEYICPEEKYMEGKKCKLPDGSIMVMGKILKKRPCGVKELNVSGGMGTCII